MRLIDADVLVRDINADPYRTESEKSYDRCLVHRQPTVEASPVVPGRWIGPTRVDANNNKYECSECGFWGVPGWAACPKCTAKMDGGVSDG